MPSDIIPAARIPTPISSKRREDFMEYSQIASSPSAAFSAIHKVGRLSETVGKKSRAGAIAFRETTFFAMLSSCPNAPEVRPTLFADSTCPLQLTILPFADYLRCIRPDENTALRSSPGGQNSPLARSSLDAAI